jgi:hypothetical protein
MKEMKDELKGKTLGYISAALGLVAGLAWNDAITNMINVLFPVAKDTILIKFIYALIVTLVVVLLIKSLEKALTNGDKN